MKISYIMQYGADVRKPPFDGPANHVRQVIGELKNLGHQVDLLIGIDNQIFYSADLIHFDQVIIKKSDTGILRLLERFIRRIQYELHLPFAGYFDSLRFSLACSEILSDSDVFLERLSWMGYGGAIASRRMKKPLILEYNGDPLHDLDAKHIAPQGIQRKFSKKLLKYSLSRASKIIASGRGWQDNLIHHWGIKPGKVVTIENGTDLTGMLDRTELSSFREVEAGELEITIVYLGGFYAWHGTQILVRAFQRCLAKHQNIKLIMIGSGPGFDETRALVHRLNIEKKVSFTGRLRPEEYAPLLKNAQIGVSPYCNWVEYSGLKLFDYKAAGLGIIASGENGNPVTITNGKSGLIIPPCDEDALVENLIGLIQNHDLRRSLGQKARLEAEKLHTWQHSAREIEKTLSNTMKTTQPISKPADLRQL